MKFIWNLLPNTSDNLAKGIYKIICEVGYDNKKCSDCGIEYKFYDFCLKYTNVKDDLLRYKCSWCNRIYQESFDEHLKKRFANLYNFSIIT